MIEFDQIVGDIKKSIDDRVSAAEKLAKEAGIRADATAKLVQAFTSSDYAKGDMSQVEQKACETLGCGILAVFHPDGHYRGAAAEHAADYDLDVKAMHGSTVREGGALVPDAMNSAVIVLLPKYSVFQRNARVVKMSARTEIWPKVNTDVTVYAPGEGGTITDSDLGLANVSLTATKLASLTYVSRELAIEDSVTQIAGIIGESFARALGKALDQAGFLGDGTSSYYGYSGLTGAFQSLASYSAQAASSVYGGLVTAAGNAYSEITLANFHSVIGALPEDFDAEAKWYMSKKFYHNIVWPLAETAGNASIFEILSDKKDKSFLGYPVEFTSVMPSTEANSQLCCFLGDLKMGAYLGQKRELEMATSEDVAFASDSIAVRGTMRAAINVFGYGDTTTAGPICALITFAS